MLPRFGRGDAVLYRGIDERKRIVSVIPTRVVRDDAELVALWMPLGVPSIRPVLVKHAPGEPRRWVDGNWYLAPSTWRWAELLILVKPGEHRATWVRWSRDRVFDGWAVNMQDELIRTPLGFDVHDHQLDIVVKPDRTWQWKDEGDLN